MHAFTRGMVGNGPVAEDGTDETDGTDVSYRSYLPYQFHNPVAPGQRGAAKLRCPVRFNGGQPAQDVAGPGALPGVLNPGHRVPKSQLGGMQCETRGLTVVR